MRLELYPHPGSPSDPPKWEDIERMALHYPEARVVVILVERGEMTREQGLIRLVFAFAGAFQELFSAEAQRRMVEPPTKQFPCGPARSDR